ncbi:MAG: TolC family protein [Prolixibacteraceae bacterium]
MQKNLIKTITLPVLMLAFSLNNQAQQKMALSDLIDRVLTENYQVKIVRNEALQAANDNSLGNAGFLPAVDIQGTTSRAVNNTKQELFNGTTREGEDAQSKVLSGFIEANWTVFDGFRMFAMRDKLSLLEQIGTVDARYFIEQTIADVSVAYYQLIRENNLLNNLQKTFEVSLFRYKLESKKRQVGSGTTLDYNLALMDYHSDSLSIIEQQQVIKSLQIQLNRLSRRDPDATLIPADQELSPDTIEDKEMLTDLAVTANKDIKLSMIREMIAEKDVRISQAARYPQLDLFGRYSYSRQINDIGVTQQNKTYGRTLGITVRMNLFDGGKLNKAIANEKLASENSILTRQNATELIVSEVLDQYYAYQSLKKQQSVARENIKLAEQSQEIARTQLEKGAINGYDFRQTQLAVITARNQLTQINFSLKALETEINRLTGKLESLL